MHKNCNSMFHHMEQHELLVNTLGNCSSKLYLLIKYQTSHLNTLPRRRILGRTGIMERAMRSPHRQPGNPTRLALAKRVVALEQEHLIGRHFLLKVKAVIRIGSHLNVLAAGLVALDGARGQGIGKLLLTAVIVVVVVCSRVAIAQTRISTALGIHEIHGDKVPGLGGAPVHDGQGKVDGGVLYGPPRVDDGEAAAQQLVGLGLGQVAPHPRRGRGRRLVDVDLLHGLAGRVGPARPADGVVEDVHFFNVALTPSLERAPQQGLDLGVIGPADCFLAGKELLLGGGVHDGEAAIVRGELVLAPAEVVDCPLVALVAVGLVWAVGLGPRLASEGVWNYVVKNCRRHGFLGMMMDDREQ
jgi:GNAT superfamily N-acetyltransferase